MTYWTFNADIRDHPKINLTGQMFLMCRRSMFFSTLLVRPSPHMPGKTFTVRSRANGNSSKWEYFQKNHAEWLKMGTFVKWDSFEHSNAPKREANFFASYSRANGNSSKCEYFLKVLAFGHSSGGRGTGGCPQRATRAPARPEGHCAAIGIKIQFASTMSCKTTMSFSHISQDCLLICA